jgi:ComF family protein
MNTVKKIFLVFKNFLFPQGCAICMAGLKNISEIKYGLCEECRTGFLQNMGNKCNLCGKPLISEIELCLPCREGARHSYDRLWVIFPYSGKYRKLLTMYKFKKILSLANLLAEKILDVLGEPLLKDAVIVPVPPRPGKIKDTGWDQVDYLVRRLTLLSKGSVSFCRCLRRIKSKTQKRLDRAERIENLKGRISVCGEVPKTVLVIDDVITTGSTMEVCSSVLKENGAEKVYGLCLFYD